MSILPRRIAEWALLTVQLPERPPQPAGVLLTDSIDRCHVLLRRDWSTVAPDEDAAILSELEADLIERGRECGGSAVLDWLEGSASHVIELGERKPIETTNAEQSLRELFNEYVAGALKPRDTSPQTGHRAHVAFIAGLLIAATLVPK